MFAVSEFQAVSNDLARRRLYPLADFMAQDFRPDAVRHAEHEYPKESVGLIVDGKYVPCRNTADDPENTFVISPVDYAQAMFVGTIEAVVHSHPQGTPVSEHDRKACKQTKIPWYVYSVPDQQWLTVDP